MYEKVTVRQRVRSKNAGAAPQLVPTHLMNCSKVNQVNNRDSSATESSFIHLLD